MFTIRAARVATVATMLLVSSVRGGAEAHESHGALIARDAISMPTQSTPGSGDIVDAINDSLPLLSRPGAVLERVVHRYTEREEAYAAVLDLASTDTSADARISIVRLGPELEVLVSETTSGLLDAVTHHAPRDHLDPGPTVTEDDSSVVCVKQDPVLVQDERCESKRQLAIAAAAAICATSIFLGPFGGAACVAAQSAVALYNCVPILIQPPPVCHRIYPEPAEPAVKEAEEQSGTERPRFCRSPNGGRNPACD